MSAHRKFRKNFPLLNTLIAGIALIMMWRGIWGLMDHYLIPHNPILSNVISLVLGFVILILLDDKLERFK